MAYYHNESRPFTGLPHAAYLPESVGKPISVDDPAAVAWHLEVDFEDGPAEFAELFEHFLTDVGGENVTALRIGQWGGAAYEHKAPVALLAAKAPALPNLRSLHLGDMDAEQCEISWIQHDDITPILAAYPALENLIVRGSEGLRLRPMSLPSLRGLVFESGGLPAEVTRAVGQCDLPALAHLELWLGVDQYGGTTTIADLAEILSGSRLPAITSLGLCDSEIQDEVAEAVAVAPVVARLDVLDLSIGTMTDRGARALLAGQPLTHLRVLNLDYHWMSTEMMARLRADLPTVRVCLEDRHDVEQFGFGPFVSVSE